MRFFSFSFLMSALFVLSSSPVWARIDTVRAFPEKRFVDGAMGFGQYVARSLRYPLQAQQSATVGTSLVSFLVTPAGKLTDVCIVNSLGEPIDDEVMHVIRSTAKRWKPAEQPESQDSLRMIMPVIFSLGDVKFYVEPVKPAFLLKDIIVVGYGSRLNNSILDDAYYVNQLTTAFEKKDYKGMLKSVNELIRRNPYNEKLYFQRAGIERQLGQTDAACRDYNLIIHFLGKSRLPKQFVQNCP